MKLKQHKFCTGCHASKTPSFYPFRMACELEHEIKIVNFDGVPVGKCYKPLNNDEYLEARNLVFKASNDYDEDELTCMVQDCKARESKLSDWECGFVDTCDTFTRKQIMLSARQREILTEIWERIT